MVSTHPAARFGLANKGEIEVGRDADIALVDPTVSWTVRAVDSPSTQEYTPFEGQELHAAVTHTLLRGEPVVKDGVVVGGARGRYQRRPVTL
jgi:allantoinase